jgi:hypothetical protein
VNSFGLVSEQNKNKNKNKNNSEEKEKSIGDEKKGCSERERECVYRFVCIDKKRKTYS